MPTSVMFLAASGPCPLAHHLALSSSHFSTAFNGGTNETIWRRALDFVPNSPAHVPGGKLRLAFRSGSLGGAAYGTAHIPAPCRAGEKLQTLSACAYGRPNFPQYNLGKKIAHATAGQSQRSQGGRSVERKLEWQGGSKGKGRGAVQVKSAATRAGPTADVSTGSVQHSALFSF
jgi:hypothetical protein